MLKVERQNMIATYINKNNQASVNELAALTGASLVTIRNDIDELAKSGIITRVHGGAISTEYQINKEVPSIYKEHINSEAKSIIGQYASKLIKKDNIIILDSGTTTLQIAKEMENINCTVITNDIRIAIEISKKSNINLIVSGGARVPTLYTLLGPNTISFYSNISSNILFLGCDAFSVDFGISNRTLDETLVKKTMIKSADKVIAVLDHTKLNKTVFAKVCDCEEIDVLIVDSDPNNYLSKVKNGKTKIIVVDQLEKEETNE